MDSRILIFGDSITYGAWDTSGGWADRLKQWAHKRTIESTSTDKIQVLNLGIGGDTSTGVLKRLEAEVEARYSASWPFAFIFAIGTNDERVKNGQIETPLEEFKQSIQGIIDAARKHTDKILFIGLPPLAENTVSFKDQEYSDKRIAEYEHAAREIVQSSGLPFIEVRSAFEGSSENLFSDDKLHPNDDGHAILADIIVPAVEELLK